MSHKALSRQSQLAAEDPDLIVNRLDRIWSTIWAPGVVERCWAVVVLSIVLKRQWSHATLSGILSLRKENCTSHQESLSYQLHRRSTQGTTCRAPCLRTQTIKTYRL
jgi:hypothetical protein